jgi:hypothetical protein
MQTWERWVDKPIQCPPETVALASRSKVKAVRDLVRFLDRQVKQERVLRRELKNADYSSMVALRLLAHHLHVVIERESARRYWRMNKRVWMRNFNAEARLKKVEAKRPAQARAVKA